MTEAIVTAIITGGLALAGTVFTCLATGRKSQKTIEINQAVVNTKIESLTDEVRAHNNFARRMPVVEEQIKVVNHRLDDLEQFHKPK